MKHLLFVAVLAMFLPPYQNITEEIFINEDGSGRYNVYTNEVPMLKQAIMVRLQTEDMPIKNIENKVKEEVWANHSMNFNEASSPLNNATKEVLADPTKKKLLRNITNFKIGNRVKNTIDAGVMCKFDNLEELSQLMTLLRTDPLQSLASLQLKESSAVFELNNNKFTKQTLRTNKKQFFSTSQEGTFTTNLYLPSDVKKVKGSFLKHKKGRLVSFEYKLSEVLSGKIDTDFAVRWKK